MMSVSDKLLDNVPHRYTHSSKIIGSFMTEGTAHERSFGRMNTDNISKNWHTNRVIGKWSRLSLVSKVPTYTGTNDEQGEAEVQF